MFGSVAPPLLEAVQPASAPVSNAVRERYRRLAVAMATTDAVAAFLAFVAAYEVRHGLQGLPSANFLFLTAVSVLVWVGLFAGFGLYGVHRLAPSEEFRRLLAAVSVGVASVALFSFWASAPISRQLLAWSWLLSFPFVLTGRRVWHWWMRGARERGTLAFPTLIGGTNGAGTH